MTVPPRLSDALADRYRIESELGAGGFLTTEKDAINLGVMASQLAPMSIATLQLTLDRPADLVDAIQSRIAERKPRS